MIENIGSRGVGGGNRSSEETQEASISSQIALLAKAMNDVMHTVQHHLETATDSRTKIEASRAHIMELALSEALDNLRKLEDAIAEMESVGKWLCFFKWLAVAVTVLLAAVTANPSLLLLTAALCALDEAGVTDKAVSGLSQGLQSLFNLPPEVADLLAVALICAAAAAAGGAGRGAAKACSMTVKASAKAVMVMSALAAASATNLPTYLSAAIVSALPEGDTKNGLQLALTIIFSIVLAVASFKCAGSFKSGGTASAGQGSSLLAKYKSWANTSDLAALLFRFCLGTNLGAAGASAGCHFRLGTVKGDAADYSKEQGEKRALYALQAAINNLNSDSYSRITEGLQKQNSKTVQELMMAGHGLSRVNIEGMKEVCA